MRKKVIALFLAGGLMLGMSGCGGSQATVAVSANTDTESTTVQEPEVEETTATNFDQAETEETETIPEEENLASSVDTSSLLTDYVLEYEDYDGYQIRETLQISPIFREGDSETMYALWEALGNDAWDFPSKDAFIEANHAMMGRNKFEYVIGTLSIENLTEGFHITSDNPRNYNGVLKAEGVSNPAELFNLQSASAVVYSSNITYYKSEFEVFAGKPKMTSDTWGPRTFVIALPNNYTPNEPDGYHYDELTIIFRYHEYGSFNKYEKTLTLEYFEE